MQVDQHITWDERIAFLDSTVAASSTPTHLAPDNAFWNIGINAYFGGDLVFTERGTGERVPWHDFTSPIVKKPLACPVTNKKGDFHVTHDNRKTFKPSTTPMPDCSH